MNREDDDAAINHRKLFEDNEDFIFEQDLQLLTPQTSTKHSWKKIFPSTRQLFTASMVSTTCFFLQNLMIFGQLRDSGQFWLKGLSDIRALSELTC